MQLVSVVIVSEQLMWIWSIGVLSVSFMSHREKNTFVLPSHGLYSILVFPQHAQWLLPLSTDWSIPFSLLKLLSLTFLHLQHLTFDLCMDPDFFSSFRPHWESVLFFGTSEHQPLRSDAQRSKINGNRNWSVLSVCQINVRILITVDVIGFKNTDGGSTDTEMTASGDKLTIDLPWIVSPTGCDQHLKISDVTLNWRHTHLLTSHLDSIHSVWVLFLFVASKLTLLDSYEQKHVAHVDNPKISCLAGDKNSTGETLLSLPSWQRAPSKHWNTWARF